MEKGKSFGEEYLKSYAEIPKALVKDEAIVGRKLSGHLRLFDPLDIDGARNWYHSNYESLCLAYGEERVNGFLLSMAFGVPDKPGRGAGN